MSDHESLDGNLGERRRPALDDVYGMAPDQQRIRYWRELWMLES